MQRSFVCMEDEKILKSQNTNNNQTQEFSSTFAVFLCLFFIYLFRVSIGAFGQLSFSFIPDVSRGDWRLVKVFYYAISFFWLLFGFWAIILSLKKAPSAIPSLRICLVYHLFAFLLSMYEKRQMLSRYSTVFLFFGIAFFVLFLLYLSKSKRLAFLFPNYNRHWGLLTWLETLGIFSYISIIVFGGTHLISKRKAVKAYSSIEYRLLQNEVSDGRAIFSPLNSWIGTLQPIEESGNTVYSFKDTVSYATIEVTISGDEIPESRSEYVYTVFDNQPLATNLFRTQLCHSSELTKERYYYLDQYQYQDDTSKLFWTYSTLGSKKRPISIRLSVAEKDSLTMTVAEVKRFFEGVELNITHRLLKKDY